MAIGSGVGSAFGMVDEVAFGTLPASPTFRWHDAKDTQPDLKLVKNTQQGGGMASGRLAPPASRRVITSKGGTISKLPLEVVNNKMGLILKHIFGGVVTPVQQAATIAYLQTHVAVDNVGRSFDAQMQVPQTDGTIKAYTGRGGKITSAEFTCGVDELLMVNLSADFQTVLDTDATASPSYATGQWPFHHALMNVKLGATSGAESAVGGVRKATIKFERPQDTGEIYAGAGGLKSEQLMNDWIKITGSFDVDFKVKADFADRFQNDTVAAAVVEWVGLTAIAAANFPAFRVKIPAINFNGDGTPTVDGLGVVSTTFNFEALTDTAGNPLCTAEYMSTDVAL